MKKILISAVLLLAVPAVASAGYMGGLSDTLGGQMLTVTAAIGYETREVEKGSFDDDFTTRSLTVKTTYGYSDKADIYLNLGFADIQDISSFDGALGNLYGVGMKFLLFGGANSDAKISIDFGLETYESRDSGLDYEYLEYYAAATVSKKSGNFTPYGGIKLSDGEVDREGGSDLDTEDSFGIFGGVDYFVNPNVYFLGEVHIFAEESLFLGVGYNF